MVRTVSSIYGIWLAGYYDDFNSARAIPDDTNVPNNAGTYSITSSHYGNPINGEATLNPRYRFSIADRQRTSGSNFVSSTSNQYLNNSGIFEWLSYDSIRQDANKWEGRAQVQYPDGHIANRYEFNSVTSEDYLLFSNGYDTLGKYYIGTGDNDATFGRTSMEPYESSHYNAKNSGVIDATGDFIQRGHLIGTWMGETLGQTGTWNSSSTTPRNLFAPVKSPSGQPFLAIQTWRTLYNSSSGKPTLIYKGPLNSRLDGDTFTARIAARSFNGATSSNGKIDLNLKFEIGFETTDFPTSSISAGFSGTAAIDKVIDLDSVSTIVYDALGFGYINSNTSQNIINDDTWIDFDFVMDYTAQTFDMYINGQLKVNNEAFDETRTAENMYGFQLTLEPKSGSSTTTTLMVDRVGLVRYLTDAEDYASYDTPIQSLDIILPINGISNATLRISDIAKKESGGPSNLNVGMRKQDYLLNLKNIFSGNTPVDWSLLVFANQTPRIDRPVWRGIINSMSITQQDDKSRQLIFSASDSLTLLDRQVPLWEVGQKGINDNQSGVTNYWSYDAQGFKGIMNLGSLPLKVLNNNVGFNVDDSYLETADQRMQLGSGHPIQMYNNEDSVFGPNSIEQQYEGINTESFYEILVGGTKRTTIDVPVGHGYETTSSLTLSDSASYNATNINPVQKTSTTLSFSQTDLPYVAGNGSVIYAGKYLGMDTGDLNMSGYELREWEKNIAPLFPQSTDYTSQFITVFFDANPSLNINDKFFINKLNIGGSSETTNSGLYTVTKVTKILNYFADNLPSDYIWCVTTSSPYTSNEFGTYTSNSGMKTGNYRKSWSKDITTITPPPSTFDSAKYKTLHARWMRDLPNSLWFKYHFGQIKYDSIDTCTLPATVSIGDTYVPITSALYITLRDWSYSNEGNYLSGVAELVSGNNVTKFIYRGIAADGGNYYLVGCKYISEKYTHNNPLETLSSVKILDISDDYKHIWLLWADMRNNGKADADGGFRNKEFGLQYPTNENYDISLYYVDQTDADGNIDKFASLKIGDDLDVWNVDATSEPISNAAFSKTPDYSLGDTVTITYGANQLVITGATETNYTVGSYASIYNSLYYDGTYEISAISGSTSITVKGVTAGTNTNSPMGSVMCAPAGASEKETDTIYHDWEDKAGAFLVIDSAPFFNLNTLANKGKSGQSSGGNTDLKDYVATVHGFPALIDNYWAEAISSYHTTASPYLQHPNTRRLLSDATLANEGLHDGDMGLPIKDSSKFSTYGSGIIVADLTEEEKKAEMYISWSGKLETEVVNTNITSVTLSPYAVADYGENTRIIKTGETFETKGVNTGFLIKNTTNDPATRHYVITVESETSLIVSGVWAAGNNYTLPVQLGNVKLQSVKSITSSVRDSPTAVEEELLSNYITCWFDYPSYRSLGIDIDMTIAGENPNAKSITVNSTVSSQYMLRLLMHIEGNVKSENSGSFYDSSKFRMLWSAALMETWLSKTRLSCAFDINNIPITNLMTTYNDTNSNDSYGSMVNSQTKTILSTIGDTRGKSGFGGINGLKTTFSYLMGKDGRIEYRPKYNSGLVFTRENLKISNLDTTVSGQITNVRVYYNQNKSFVDYPPTNLTDDTTRWKILEYPTVKSSIEAVAVAKQSYNQNQNTRLSIKAEPILEGGVSNKMIDSGRFGYISDPQLALQGYGDYDSSDTNKGNSWTRLGTGGVPFSGMNNALDGNMKTSTDIYNRYGTSLRHLNIPTTTNINWDDNYYWYGSRSLSYALQIVHIPNFTPKVSNTTTEPLRVFVALKNTQAATATIDDCEFTIHLGDYSFANIQRTPTLNQTTSKDVKNSGFYEISIPSNYGAVANATIVVSFNAEYCRALLRHRCGLPSSSEILKNANSVVGISMQSSDTTPSGFNTSSIFPLGGKEYSEMYGGFTELRNEWYAPRINITNDLSYTPATYVTYTDAGIGLTDPTSLVINKITWGVFAGKKETVNFSLERDESLASSGIMGYLFPTQGQTRQVGNQSSRGYVNAPVIVPVSTIKPSPSQTSAVDNSSQQPTGATSDVGLGDADRLELNDGDNINILNKTAYGKLKGRMSLINDNISHNSKFSILGQQRPPVVPSLLKGIEGMDIDIQAASGNAAISSEGYALAGRGRVDVLGETATTTTFESTLQTQFILPIDVIDDIIIVEGKITHAFGSTLNKTAVLYTTATIEETGESITHTTYLQSNIKNKITELIPQTLLDGIKSGNKVTVTITRKAATGEDNSDRNSVILKSINVKLNRATAPVQGTSNKFSIQ